MELKSSEILLRVDESVRMSIAEGRERLKFDEVARRRFLFLFFNLELFFGLLRLSVE